MSDNGKSGFDQTSEGRAAFLETLYMAADPWTDHTSVFIQYLDDEAPQVRVTAIWGLWYNPDPELIDPLIEIAETDPSEMVRAQAISALGMYIYEGVMVDYGFDYGPVPEYLKEDDLSEADFVRVKELLLGVYADAGRSLHEQRYSIEALSFLGREVADLIEELFGRPEKEAKISALFAMGRSGLSRWAGILAQEIYSAEPDVQREAVRAVGEIRMDELGEDLWRLTYADEKDLMLEAIEALGQTGWEHGFERLDELTLDPDSEVADVAEEALSEWFLMRELEEEVGDLDEDWDQDLEEGD